MDDRSSREALTDIKKEMLNNASSEEVNMALSFLIATSGEYKFPQIMETITVQRNLIEECLSKYESVEKLSDKIALDFGVDKDCSIEKVEAEFWQELDVDKLRVVIKMVKN